jgi:predicted nucleic acid-binding protein
MATYVVDASIVVQYAIEQDQTAAVRNLVARMYRGNEELIIPEFCLLECTNVIWKEVRFQGLSPTHAEALVNELLTLAFRVLPTKHLLPEALKIGVSCELAIYDSLYIALALEHKYPLITVDNRQQNGAIVSGSSLKAITDFLADS